MSVYKIEILVTVDTETEELAEELAKNEVLDALDYWDEYIYDVKIISCIKQY